MRNAPLFVSAPSVQVITGLVIPTRSVPLAVWCSGFRGGLLGHRPGGRSSAGLRRFEHAAAGRERTAVWSGVPFTAQDC